MTSCGDREALPLGLELQDRDPRLEVGRLDVDAQPPPEPADQPFLQPRQLVRRPVGRDRDLPRAAVQVVERVEELGLRLFALGEELDVVDQQDVDLAVPLAEPIALPLAHRLDELGHELLRRHVLHADPGVDPVDVMAHRDQQMRLAEPHPAVDEQRVVRRRRRRLRDGHRRGMREPVARPGDERVEGVVREREPRCAERCGCHAGLGPRRLLDRDRRREDLGGCLLHRRPQSLLDLELDLDRPAACRGGRVLDQRKMVVLQTFADERARNRQREDVGVQRGGADVGEPHDERGLRELLARSGQDGRPRIARGMLRVCGHHAYSTGPFHNGGKP